MDDLFAPFEPRDRNRPRESPRALVIRPTAEADIEALSRISQQRNGGDVQTHRNGFEGLLLRAAGAGDYLVLTALIDNRPIAFGKAGVFTPPSDAPSNCAPAGWYLFGVVVAPEARRMGIGLELTRRRLAHVREQGADVAYYFASALNRVTIDLHARLGFDEVTRDFWFPGVSFTGGVGILFRANPAR